MRTRRFLAIVSHELQEGIRSRRTLRLAGGICVVFSAACLVGLLEHRQRVQRHTEFTQSERNRWLSMRPTDPHVASHIGIHVMRPAPLLGWFDPGVDQFAGSWEHLEAHRGAELRDPPVRDEIPGWRRRLFVPATWCQGWLSLLVILLVTLSISDELESGIWSWIATQGVSLRCWGLARLLGLVVPIVLAVVLPMTVFAILAVYWRPERAQISDLVQRLGVLSIAHLAHLILYAVLGATLAILVRQRWKAISLALGFWAWEFLAGPALCAAITGFALPVPTGLEQWERVRTEIGDRHRQSTGGFDKLKQRLMAEYGVTRVKDLPINPIGMWWIEDEARTSEIFSDIRQDVVSNLEEQQALQKAFAWTSPSREVETISMLASGSSSFDVQRFQVAFEQYRRGMNDRLNHEKAHNKSIVESRSETLPGKELWKQIPEFIPPIGTLREVADRLRVCCASLCLWGFVVSAAFLWATRGAPA